MSGARSIRRSKFISEHPFCCFCGGDSPATTEDHTPGRGLFLNRLWPLGYVFPACVACNNSSSNDELMLSWATRIRIRDFTSEEEIDFTRVSQNIQRVLPNIWNAIRLFSRIETRQLLRSSKLPKNIPNSTDIIGAFEMPEEMLAGAKRYAVKLGKALHYKHTSKIVPASAVIRTRVFPVMTVLSPDFPSQIFSLLTIQPKIERAANNFYGQFDYRYVTVEDGAASSFVVTFGDGLGMIIIIFCDADRYTETIQNREMSAVVDEE